MFQNLTQKLTSVLDGLKGRGALTEKDVVAALRDIRIALLEADVALPVAKQLIQDVKELATGQNVLKSITPGQMIVKIVHDHLVRLLGEEVVPLNTKAQSPFSYLMVGLQGSGKTTSSAKIAGFMHRTMHKKPLLVSLDVYRPAAQKQLEILGQQLNIDSLDIVEGEKPLDIAARGLAFAKKHGHDVVFFDTAGRLHIDDHLMEEVRALHQLIAPLETLLVGDAMTGQDAVVMAKAFQDVVPLTGIVLTRTDGDARGGAALSMRYITGQPIKVMGTGEKIDQIEVFNPVRIADRILDRGDVVALVEKAASLVDDADAQKMTAKMQKGQFDLNDLSKYLDQMMKMGGMGGLMNMLPGMGKIKDKIAESGIDDKVILKQKAIISSMTPKERRYPTLLNASRKKRVARGCGMQVQDVNKLLKQYEQMAVMMKRMKKMGTGKKFMRGGLKGLFGG